MFKRSGGCCCRWLCVVAEDEATQETVAVRIMPSNDTEAEKGTKDAPDWLDAMLIEDALHRLGDKNVHVERIVVRLATAPGENFGSALYRVRAHLAGSDGVSGGGGEGGERSLLVKAPPLAQAVAQSVAEAGLFERETSMLTRLLPQMQALLEEAEEPVGRALAARCPLHGATPVEFLVLEDLAPLGFKMADRRLGMGLRHSLCALRALARFHAASHALLRRDSAAAHGLDNPLRRQSGAFDHFFSGALQAAADACRTWPGYEQYATSLEVFKENAVSKITELHDSKLEGFNVILHGDFWINNIMYNYNNNGNPKDLRFVDFQISHVASPALDVLYLLSTSLSEDVSENHCGLLLREYHACLRRTLALLSLEAPPLEALLQDMHVHGAYAVYGSIVLLPIMKAKKVTDVGAALEGETEASSHAFRDPEVRRWLQRLLPDYKRRGWLP